MKTDIECAAYRSGFQWKVNHEQMCRQLSSEQVARLAQDYTHLMLFRSLYHQPNGDKQCYHAAHQRFHAFQQGYRGEKLSTFGDAQLLQRD